MKFILVFILFACFAFSKAQDGPLCTPCQYGVELVKDYLTLPDDKILEILSKACERLPDNIQVACKVAVTLVGKQMVQYIRQNFREEPRVICQRFGLCRRNEEVAIIQDGPLCGPCQLGVNLVKEYISKPDDELLGMLLKACESLPNDLQAPCKMAVTLVGKQMLEFIRGNLRESPRVICARFNLCAPQQTEEEKNKIQCILKCLGNGWNVQRVLQLLAKCKTDKKCYVKELGEHAANCVFGCLSNEKQDTPLCAPCQLGVQLVKDYISKPDDELLSMLLKGCEVLPQDLQAPCKMAVTLVGKQMLEFIRGNLREPARTICARFRLCSASEEVVALIADEPQATEEEKNKVQCVLKCLGSGWNVPRVLKLIAKCKTNKACYIKEVGQRAGECIVKCF